MRFEHLVQINDPLNPLIEPLTRGQVWQGLLLRAERPQVFTAHLVGARIVVRGEYYLARELDFGSFKVRDRVRLEPMQRMLIETDPSDDFSFGTLTVTIEEPGVDHLQLRFEYVVQRTHGETLQQEASYDRLVKAAYHAADIDCVRIIRHHAAGLV
jgi:hypothetical protein